MFILQKNKLISFTTLVYLRRCCFDFLTCTSDIETVYRFNFYKITQRQEKSVLNKCKIDFFPFSFFLQDRNKHAKSTSSRRNNQRTVGINIQLPRLGFHYAKKLMKFYTRKFIYLEFVMTKDQIKLLLKVPITVLKIL